MFEENKTPTTYKMNTQETARLEQFKKQRRIEEAPFKYTKSDKSDEKNIAIKMEFFDKSLTDQQKSELFAATMHAATGQANQDCFNVFLYQMGNALHNQPGMETEAKLNAAMATLLAMGPRDVFESSLCKNLVILEDHIVTNMARAARTNASNGIESSINLAAKLIRLRNETLEALNKHRRKGEQKVTVQHVNVNNGGQAIVGAAFNRGEGTDEKSR